MRSVQMASTLSAQHFPLGRIVRRPCYHSAVSGVNPANHVCVDKGLVLPQIFGACFDERGERVEMTRYFQNSRSNGRENLFHVLNDPVVEGVDSAVRGRFADAANTAAQCPFP